MTVELNALLCGEGENREDFEKKINSGIARYSLGRNEHGEYVQAAVFHMWTGYCLAKAT